MSVNTVAVHNPPMITMASGFCTSDPGSVDAAAGSRPSMASVAVINTGRSCCSAPRTAASRTEPVHSR